MIRTLPIAVLLLLGSLLPQAASAYVLPEEVLDEATTGVRFFDPPPAARHVVDIQREQAERSAARRQAALDALRGESSSSAAAEEPEATETGEEEQTTGGASIDPAQLENVLNALEELQNKEATVTEEDERDARTLQRIRLQQEQARIRAQVAEEMRLARESDGETLHSGAPLADTGPATLLAAMAVLAAVIVTLRWVRGMEKR